jgi:hypothetical protein
MLLAGASPILAETESTRLAWYDDYAEASRAARQSSQMLVLIFCDERHPDAYADYIKHLEGSERFAKAADNFVLCKVPTNFEVVLSEDKKEGEKSVLKKVDGSQDEAAETVAAAERPRIKLMSHPAFADMNGHPGIAIIDYTREKSQYYGRVVSIYPFKTRFLPAERLLTMINLPEGSLTQRTMIFAVMTHPERPASIQGQFAKELAEESESHSRHQANIRVQGHHQWESRFHRINARLGRGMTAREVVAESWPGQDLVEACEECVHSWRQSSGHWDAVRSRHPFFAFDIKRGGNGIWYATGIFGQ